MGVGLKVLYIGDLSPGSTSFHRFCALKRIGCDVVSFDSGQVFGGIHASKVMSFVNFRTGYRLVQSRSVDFVRETLKAAVRCDLVWIDSGEFFGPAALEFIKKNQNSPVLLFCNDDLTGYRDGRRFDMARAALPFYDLCVVREEKDVAEYERFGAKSVLKSLLSYDELEHVPRPRYQDIPDRFRSDVAFIGTWMRHEARDEFLLKLIESGINVAIYGGRWEKSSAWSRIRPYVRGGVLSGRDYADAIQGSKVCLGFVSAGNRDRHTRRTFEIPACGGLLCAVRTDIHQSIYDEGSEALFFEDEKECISKCQAALSDELFRREILRRGGEKVRALRVGNEDVVKKVLEKLGCS